MRKVDGGIQLQFFELKSLGDAVLGGLDFWVQAQGPLDPRFYDSGFRLFCFRVFADLSDPNTFNQHPYCLTPLSLEIIGFRRLQARSSMPCSRQETIDVSSSCLKHA